MLRRTLATGFAAIEGYLDRIVCVVGAVLLAQAPEFFQQYFQRLGGHLDEARRQLTQFEASAAAAGKTWAQFLQDTLANADPGLARLGETMRATATRVSDLQQAHDAMAQASAWSRPWAFVQHADWPIVRGTLGVFKPAVPTTLEGAVYAAVGVAAAFGLWHLAVRLPLRRWLRPRHSVLEPVRAR